MTLEVTQGSVVSVDPDELRQLARRIDKAVYHAASAMGAVRAADELQRTTPIPELAGMWPCTDGLFVQCQTAYEESTELAQGLRLAADTYETVELLTLQQMTHQDSPVILRRMNNLYLQAPESVRMGEHLWVAWEQLTGASLVDNWAQSGAHAGMVMAVFVDQLVKLRMQHGLGRGSLGIPQRVERRAPLVPGTSDRDVRMNTTKLRDRAAPTTLAGSIARIPSGESEDLSKKARVRIERYRMSDGSEKFVAYLSGSREMPWKTDDPFCWANNVGLYLGEPGSEGYDFVLEALERAGAEAGSVVDVNGFSQGSMIAQRLATDSDFDVQRVTTIGAPLRLPMGEDVTSLTLSHDDDPVAALSDGGSPMSLGNDGSLLISRVFDDTTEGLGKWSVNAHRVSAYAQTADLFEQSGDVRGAEVREYFDDLSRATLLESHAYESRGVVDTSFSGGSSSFGDEE